ncbi:GGDEF domain-containing protein [bacterium]|nr:GGDEF domain-containing protein [candidate division CSSED10-310 bacterium]
MMLIGGIGILDFLTGYELSFSVFYILPIALITWTLDGPAGLLASFISAATWYWADFAGGHTYNHPLLPIWNSLIRMTFFMIISFLLRALKNGLLRERELAHTDYLTSAINVRYFHQIAQYKIDHFNRYHRPFTIAYIDIDNFKTINDKYGHNTGDQVLRFVVKSLKTHTRKTDVISRLGGDEFAVLLGETELEAALPVFNKIQKVLRNEMHEQGWPITFSIGVLTCRAAPSSSDEMIRMADELMYQAKAAGKDTICHGVYSG